jgi:hypothetical protein
MQTTLVLAAVVAVSGSDIGARIRDAGAAEQALQGPLDGVWTLRDARGRALYDLQLVDPIGGGQSFGGAWRDLRDGAEGRLGVLEDAWRGGAKLRFKIVRDPEGPFSIDLVKGSHGGWRGWMRSARTASEVVLRRD